MEVAARVLKAATPGLTPPRSVRSTGEYPVFTPAPPGGVVEEGVAAARSELVAQTAEGGRSAVIAPVALAEELRAAIGVPSTGAAALEQPLAVYSVDEAKGLEFDGVVVVEPAAIAGERQHGLRALYVALTRTTRRLQVVYAQPLPAGLTPTSNGVAPRPGEAPRG